LTPALEPQTLPDGRAVTHFGPSLEFVGGMASVIAALVADGIGGDAVDALPSYIPGSHPRSAVAVAAALRRIARLPRDHVVHVHMSEGGSFPREGAIVAAARLRGCPTIVSIHGPRFATFAAAHPGVVAMVLSRAHVVTVLSDADREGVLRCVPQARVELVPNPTPLDRDAPTADATEELVLFAGEIGHRKGADILEAAWPRVATSRPSARCVMVGPLVLDRPPRGERLEVRPPVAPVEIKALLRRSRMVVLPSRGEALPMILTEAMAARRPFVSTPTGGTATLADGGILVPVEDPEALADAMISLLADPELARELGGRGQELCQRTRSVEVIDSMLRTLYASSGR
jgi:glycosyltransferase involved in cell wall biosynthesis